MKSKLLLIAAAVLGLIACEGLTTINIDTVLSKSLSVEVLNNTELIRGDVKSTSELSFPFYETDTINLKENDDLNEYLDKINEMEVYKVTCKISGLTQGQTVQELTVFCPTIGVELPLFDITEFNTEIDLEASGEMLKSVGEYLLQYEELIVGVKGFVSNAPLDFKVELNFETKVKASAL